MAIEVPGDLQIQPLGGEPRTVEEWLITFHLLLVVVDPYTHESSWILDTARRIMAGFSEADIRVAWLVTADADDAKEFLGPLADEALTLLDPERALVEALELETVPALVHLGQDRTVNGSSGGWNPPEWSAIAREVARQMHWSVPLIPASGDPRPYAGSAARG